MTQGYSKSKVGFWNYYQGTQNQIQVVFLNKYTDCKYLNTCLTIYLHFRHVLSRCYPWHAQLDSKTIRYSMHGPVSRKITKRSKQKEQLYPLSRKSITHLKKLQLLPSIYYYYCSCYTFMLLFLTTVIPGAQLAICLMKSYTLFRYNR
jgi:hypothetical protein